MIGHEGKEYGFERLFEAVVYKPHTVAVLVREEPELLTCTNYVGETVMHWFVVENNLEIVELLHTCGGSVSDYALSEACSLGHVDMVYLLLRIGIIPDITSCRTNIELGKLSRNKLVKLKQAFHRYGYKLSRT